MSFTLKGVYAANVSLGGSGKTEFGQGIQVTTGCSGSSQLTVKPQISFVNAQNAGTYMLSGFSVSGVPSECAGKLFTFNFYSETGTAALGVIDSATSDVYIKIVTGSFATTQNGVSLTNVSSTGFTANFTSPAVQASQVSRITAQSGLPMAIPFAGSIDLPVADSISFPAIAAFNTGAFTVEMWIKFTAAPTANALIFQNNYGPGLWVDSSRTHFYLALWGPGSGMQTFTVPAVSLNAWHHIAVVRDGSSNAQFFLDGSRNGNASVADSNNYTAGINSLFTTGAGGDVAVKFTNLRISSAAIYSPTATSITVPTSALTLTGNTLMLLKANTDNYLLDSGQISRTITASGGVTSSSDSPFN